MQTSIATVCLSGDLSDNLRTAAEPNFDDVQRFENERLSVDGEPEGLLEGIAATAGWLPRVLRF
jgi:hypothetical protein